MSTIAESIALSSPPICFVRRSRPKPSYVFETYWRFAAERQEIFFKRLTGDNPPWTTDPILREFKFTNAYRVCDRVSQFLIREVQYCGSQEPAEVFFRTILFKLFNKIDTWSLLETEMGEISARKFNVDKFDRILTLAMEKGRRIYSAAYIMPAADRSAGVRKHRTHLFLLKKMMAERLYERLLEQKSLARCFDLLRSYPMMGTFLAFQYVIDLNYSTLLNHSEMDFVVPGPGARAGIKKCFTTLGDYTEAETIQIMAEEQAQCFDSLGLFYKSLWGRPLQLIDCQNIFCEVDKYSRLAHPELNDASGRHKIKQRFQPLGEQIRYWFPPKWNINDLVEG